MANNTTAVAPVRRLGSFRFAAIGLVVATLAYIVPSALHGNPPIDSAHDTLAYVADRSGWRIVHLVNIAAVLGWVVSMAALGQSYAAHRPQLRRSVTLVATVAAAVFAVYFSVHAFGLSAAAEQYVAAPNDTAVLERTEALLLVLGSVAFTAQGLLGATVALFGWLVAASGRLPGWLGGIGVLVGLGWLTGALLVEFAVIVPFTALTWVWLVAVAVVVWRRPPKAPTGEAPLTEAPTTGTAR